MREGVGSKSSRSLPVTSSSCGLRCRARDGAGFYSAFWFIGVLCCRVTMPGRRVLIAAAIVSIFTGSAARAQTVFQLDIPAGPLSRALVELGKQSQTPVALVDTWGGKVRTRRIQGRLTIEQALVRLLNGTGFAFRRSSAGDVIVARAMPRIGKHAARRARPPGPGGGIRTRDDKPIVVTASKRNMALSDFPGSITVINEPSAITSARPGGGSALLVDQLPVLAGTNLGAGRNKLFARGIADGSFNGQSQANVGMYLGDLRLLYNGPDPDLNLFDIKRVEVLTGPYGTLYGTGALGGVIRLEAHAPDLDRAGGRFAVGVSTTRHGATGGNIAGVLNVPIATQQAGLRVLAYRVEDPGFVDDTGRELKDVNKVSTTGGRAILRVEPSPDLTVDIGVLGQRISARDSQYTNDNSDKLIKLGVRAQPYSSDYLLPSVTVVKRWDDLTLSSATGWVRQRRSEIVDVYGILTYALKTKTEMLAHETRVSGEIGDVQMVTGLSIVNNRFRENRQVEFIFSPFGGVRFEGSTLDIALFGEAGINIVPDLRATLGARINYIRDARSTVETETETKSSGNRSAVSLLPSLSLSWKMGDDWLTYLSYRTGQRGGNLLVDSRAEVPVIYATKPDRLTSIEAGIRFALSGPLRFSAAVTHSEWNRLQSDLPTNVGSTRTVNIGNATIWGFETTASWQPINQLSISAAAFFNNAPAVRPSDETIALVPADFFAEGAKLPNIAAIGARGAFRFEVPLGGGLLNLASALRYYGSSRSEYRTVQPSYLELGIETGFTINRWTVSLEATNLIDSRASRFGLGNYFAVELDQRQFTPLQPRTIRLGLEVNF